MVCVICKVSGTVATLYYGRNGYGGALSWFLSECFHVRCNDVLPFKFGESALNLHRINGSNANFRKCHWSCLSTIAMHQVRQNNSFCCFLSVLWNISGLVLWLARRQYLLREVVALKSEKLCWMCRRSVFWCDARVCRSISLPTYYLVTTQQLSDSCCQLSRHIYRSTF